MGNEDRSRLLLKKVVSESIFILLFSSFIAIVVNSFKADGLRFFHSEHEPAQHSTLSEDLNPAQITIERAISEFDNKNALFLDSRPEADFLNGHIEGAINLPDHEFDERIGEFFMTTEPDTLIITYCDGEQCVLAKHLAEKLISVGFTNVYYLSNGWTSWQEAMHGISKDAVAK